MPKNRKKSGKRKSPRQLFKIGPCTSPETISPEIDDSVQNGQDNDDIEEEHSTIDSGKQKDVEDNLNTSPKAGLYIDPIVKDSRKEILLNLKNLIQQNVKQIKDMRKCKAQLNIAVHKAELRVDRTKKSNDEMKVKITTLRADFWLKAKQFPATVSLKVNKCDNWVRKRKQDIVDDLNTVKRKEKLLKEFIPKLIKENALRKTWTPTVPMITFSPVIEHLNSQFLEEFETVFRFKKLKPGIYFRHPFYRTTYHVSEERVEKFKEKHPYFYYNCQRYIEKNDIEVFHQQTEEVIWNDEKKQGFNQKVIENHYVVENKQVGTSKGKANINETSLNMKRCNVMEIRNGQEDAMAIDGSTGVKIQEAVTNTDDKTSRRKENNNSDVRIVKTKSQMPTMSTKRLIQLESNVNVGKGKTTQKPRKTREHKVKIDTSRHSKEITSDDKDKSQKNQKNMVVDKKILERIDNLRKQGKDAFVKTSGDKRFIYIKPAASHGIETESDNNHHLTITVTKRGQSVSDANIVQRPPSCPIKHAALNRFGSTKQSNSLMDNIRVHAKPVPVKGKTKIPLFIRENVDYKTQTPRKPPNSNVSLPRIHLKEGQSKREVIQKKRKTHGSESTVSDAFDNKAKADRDKSNMDRQIPVSRKDITRNFTRPQTKTFNEFRNESQQQRQSLIPISVNYMKEMGQRKVVSREPAPYGHKIPLDQTMVLSREPAPYGHLNVRDQNKSVDRKPTPYDHIISQVIGEYMPWSDDEDDACDNPKVNKEDPKNSHKDNITVREKENNRTKETLKTKDKVKSNGSQSFLDQNKDVSIEPSLHNTVIVQDLRKDVSREPTPYDNIISQVIGEYMPWSDDGDDANDNPEVKKDKPENSHHDTITLKENENKRTKKASKTKAKVKTNESQSFLEDDNVITKKSRNVILLPPITPTTSPTKRAWSRSERCKSYKSEKQDKSNNDSLAVNVNSTLSDRSSVSVTVPKKSVRRTKLSDNVPCNSAQRSEGKKNEIIEIVPHPPESPKDKSNRRGRKLRTPKGKEIGLIASKMSKETNGTSTETFERGIPSTANNDHDSCDSLSKRSTNFAEHAVSKSGKTLLENIEERMLSSAMDEQFKSGAKSLRGQSQLRLPPIRNH